MTGIDVARRLVALLRLVEGTSGDQADVLSDDAMLDAWFGIRSPLLAPD